MTNKSIIFKTLYTLALSGMAILNLVNAAEINNEVSIVADKQQAVLKKNVVIFQNNVEITYGNILIKADLLEAHRRIELGDKKELLIASGTPATYLEKLENGGVISASAKEIKFDLATKTLIIKGQAKIIQEGQQINAETIIYDQNKKLISAEKDKNSNQRVHTILTPEKKKPAPDNTQPTDKK